MPKLKHYAPGKRVNIWLTRKHVKTADQIVNLSAFFQLCLDNAADIMTWDILKNTDPDTYKSTAVLEDVIDDFNVNHPQNELTQKRQGTWRENSPKKQELW